MPETPKALIAMPMSAATVLAPDRALSHLLNFSRGTAALLVLFFHIRTTLVVPYGSLETHGWLARIVFSVSAFGHDAVIIFFVLSGYLVGGAVLRLDMASSRDLRDYGIDRAARIAPVLVAATAFAAALQHLMPRSHCADNIDTVLGNALALQNFLVKPLCNNLPLWSISNEVVYYFIFPVLVALIARAFSMRLAFSLTGVVLLCLLSFKLEPLDDTSIVGDFPFWLIGAALWFVPAHFRHWRWSALLLLAGALLFGRFDAGKYHFWLRDLILSAAFSFVLVTFFDRPMPHRGVRAIFAGYAADWSRRLADFSFSLYVIHYPLVRLYAYLILSNGWESARYTSVTMPILLQLIGLGVVCILVALCFNALFERRRHFIKNAITTRLRSE